MTTKARKAEWYKENKTRLSAKRKTPEWREKYNAWRRKRKRKDKLNRLLRKFGITEQEHDAIIGRGCEACGITQGKLCIDHDHVTNLIRGCLCNQYNTALGLLKDSDRTVENLLQYLSRAKSANSRLLKERVTR